MSKKQFRGLPVRRGHLVGVYGPGAVVANQNGVTCIVSELDQWFGHNGLVYDSDDCVIQNAALAAELQVAELRCPPPTDDRVVRPIPAYRFPLWERCPSCSQVGVADRGKDATARLPCAGPAHAGKRAPLRVQLDLVVACRAGHIDDVSWAEAAHPGQEPCTASVLGGSLRIREYTGSNGAYGVDCTACGTSGEVRRDTDSPHRCKGRRLWAKDPERTRDHSCEEVPRILDRHAAALYYPRIKSALALNAGYAEDQQSAEFAALTRTTDSQDLVVRPETAGDSLPGWLGALSRVERLRETRVLTGFDRVEVAVAGTYDNMRHSVWAGRQPAWALAVDGFGEGVLIGLDRAMVQAWEADRSALLAEWREQAGPDGLPTAAVLVHTLSHLVINQIAAHSGYPSASLRERLYDSPEQLATLIYTTSGDEAGTLGGLARLGSPDRLSSLLERAEERALWCTADPLCGDEVSGVRAGHRTNGVACHRCLLLSETSCSQRNHHLDRRLVRDFLAWCRDGSSAEDTAGVVAVAGERNVHTPVTVCWDSEHAVLYDEHTFFQAFAEDLNVATRAVVIWSPYTGRRLWEVLPLLAACVRRSVDVTVVTRPDSADNPELAGRHHDALRAAGLNVRVVPSMHEKVVVIDDAIVYSGSLNPLSSTGTTSETMERKQGAAAAVALVARLP